VNPEYHVQHEEIFEQTVFANAEAVSAGARKDNERTGSFDESSDNAEIRVV
jgi:hypothetical protein